MRILIVGATGEIGSHLLGALKGLENTTVRGTTASRDKIIDKSLMFFDLRSSSPKIVDNYDCCIALAGATSIQYCTENIEESRLINVEGIKKLFDRCVQRGVYFIFLSTSHVFDGTKQFPDTEDAKQPRNEYAMQKSIVEDYINSRQAHSCILRITKVMSRKNSLTKWWDSEITKGSKIRAYSDECVSLLPLSLLGKIMRKIIELKPIGLWHLGGKAELSYYEFARCRYRTKTKDQNLVMTTVKYKDQERVSYSSLRTRLPW